MQTMAGDFRHYFHTLVVMRLYLQLLSASVCICTLLWRLQSVATKQRMRKFDNCYVNQRSHSKFQLDPFLRRCIQISKNFPMILYPSGNKAREQHCEGSITICTFATAYQNESFKSYPWVIKYVEQCILLSGDSNNYYYLP